MQLLPLIGPLKNIESSFAFLHSGIDLVTIVWNELHICFEEVQFNLV